MDLKIFSYITKDNFDNQFRCSVFKAYRKVCTIQTNSPRLNAKCRLNVTFLTLCLCFSKHFFSVFPNIFSLFFQTFCLCFPNTLSLFSKHFFSVFLTLFLCFSKHFVSVFQTLFLCFSKHVSSVFPDTLSLFFLLTLCLFSSSLLFVNNSPRPCSLFVPLAKHLKFVTICNNHQLMKRQKKKRQQ